LFLILLPLTCFFKYLMMKSLYGFPLLPVIHIYSLDLNTQKRILLNGEAASVSSV
jgi:hypothetical protein